MILSNSIYNRGMTVSEFRASGPKVLERRPRRGSNLPEAPGDFPVSFLMNKFWRNLSLRFVLLLGVVFLVASKL
jgi:hypothetical protein